MASRMKVLVVTPWYPSSSLPYSGIFVREHAKAAQLHNDVAVLHMLGSEQGLTQDYLLDKDDFNGVLDTVHKVAPQKNVPSYIMRYRPMASSNILTGFPLPNPRRRIRRHQMMQRALREVVKREFRPDIIHVHVHQTALPSIIFGTPRGIPVVITEHHSAFPLGTLSTSDIWEARIAFRLAKRVMPVSKTLQHAIEQHGIQAQFQIVPNAVDTELFSRETFQSAQPKASGEPIRLLCVGGMPTNHVKGYPYLFEALAGLTKDQAWSLEIIGDGPMMQEYMKQVAALGLGDRITFFGYQTKPEIVDAMSRADIFVLASVWENMPCVLIEAMSMGLPIVATRAGGIPEIVTEECGLLAEPRDTENLRTILVEMFNRYEQFSPVQIRTLAEKRYNYDAVGVMLDEIYRDVVGSN